MKKCSTCNIEKTEDEFDKALNRNDGLQSYCKECRKVRAKKYYQKNKKRIIKKSSDRNKLVRSHRLVKWQKFKEALQCQLCNEDYSKCLDFHHIDPATKEFTLSNMVCILPWNELMKEVDKCIVLCKCCHVKVHNGILKLL